VALLASSAAAQEPLLVGDDGVPAPKRTRFVSPEFPPEAAAMGLRGIVILELVIGPDGRVSDVVVIRSVPPFDEHATEAARQWEYEPTVVDGRPVSVRLTVPISFRWPLPEVTRQVGIPELRSGISPRVPEGADGAREVTAYVTLGSGGEVVQAETLEGEPPWSESLIQALLTWRFDQRALPEQGSLSFRVVARFPEGEDDPIDLRLVGPQTSETLVADAGSEPVAPSAPDAPSPPAPAPDPEPEPAVRPPEPAAGPEEAPQTEPAIEDEEVAGPDVGPAPDPKAEPDAGVEPEEDAVDEEPPVAPDPEAAALPSAEEGEPAGEPETITDPASEVLPAVGALLPPEPAPAPPSEPGISAVQGVFLEAGVPDLSRGRRPIVPPFARMTGENGEATVRFAVDASGETFVNSIDGPETFRMAARATVNSWFFPRQSPERLYLVATLTYEGDGARAVVRLEKAP
jgi:TonB family protein